MLKKKASLAQQICRQFKDGQWREFSDETAPEIALDLVVESGPRRTLLAFPEGLRDLVLGHALLELCPPGWLPSLVGHEGQVFTLRLIPGSPPAPVAWPGALGPEVLLRAAGRFMAMAGHWEATGCFHRAALFDPATEEFPRHVEDIGRHNCLDRLAGWSLTSGRPLAGLALFVTARATASLVGKAAASGYAVMVSRSAVTTAGVELARKADMTLVGFSRENRFSVFTDAKGLIG